MGVMVAATKGLAGTTCSSNSLYATQMTPRVFTCERMAGNAEAKLYHQFYVVLLPLSFHFPSTRRTKMPTPTISTYHCLCSELLLATPIPLPTLPLRQSDNSHICKLSPDDENITPDSAILTKSAEIESSPLILRLDDGFEKRNLIKCGRCGTRFGYFLWDSESGGVKEDVGFLLQDGLVLTEELERGRGRMEGE
ncbi:hypothetical protein AC578_9436, partial [Pseudocercospora eumusae]